MKKSPVNITSPIRLLIGLLGGWISLPTLQAAPPLPNIVMIISDDHAWTDYGFMGHPQIQTPRLDRLSEQSLTFPWGHVTSSLCCPSLASLITGLYPHQHKITSNDPPLPAGMKAAEFYRSPLFRQGRDRMNHHLGSVMTLPQWLAQRGYLSFQSGKWWQGDFRQGGFTHGMTQGGRHGDEGLKIGRAGLQPIYDFIDLAQREKKPFFLWYAPMMPHDPHTPPQRLLEKYAPKTNSLHVARYWAMIEWFDETCGQLLDFLDQRHMTTNTLVVYVADNGWIQDPNSPRYAPKSKQSPYEGGLRTPILLRWPGQIRPERSGHLAMSIDLAPVILKAAGIPVPESLPGINLLDPGVRNKRKAIYGECFTHNAIDLDRPAANLRWRWSIEESWKLIAPNPLLETNAAPELYDLDQDPHEITNLARQNPERMKRMLNQLDSWWDPSKQEKIK